jgi:hypothetical protein
MEDDMEPADQHPDNDKKIKHLEMELNDLRQGLALVGDYYKDLMKATILQEAEAEFGDTIIKPLVDEDREFDTIWKFHEETLVADLESDISRKGMYELFIAYCSKRGKCHIEQDEFEFVLMQMENPQPVLENGNWTGCRVRDNEE